jgi:hypothetical protein
MNATTCISPPPRAQVGGSIAESLEGGDHAGHHVVPTEQASDFGLEARPGARAELAQQLATETGVQPQAIGDGQHDLPAFSADPYRAASQTFHLLRRAGASQGTCGSFNRSQANSTFLPRYRWAKSRQKSPRACNTRSSAMRSWVAQAKKMTTRDGLRAPHASSHGGKSANSSPRRLYRDGFRRQSKTGNRV